MWSICIGDCWGSTAILGGRVLSTVSALSITCNRNSSTWINIKTCLSVEVNSLFLCFNKECIFRVKVRSAGGQLILAFELNFIVRKTSLLMVKPNRQTHPHSWPIYMYQVLAVNKTPESLMYLQLSQEVTQDLCFLGKILTDMVPGFLHCCILTERNEKTICRQQNIRKDSLCIHNEHWKMEHPTLYSNLFKVSIWPDSPVSGGRWSINTNSLLKSLQPKVS